MRALNGDVLIVYVCDVDVQLQRSVSVIVAHEFGEILRRSFVPAVENRLAFLDPGETAARIQLAFGDKWHFAGNHQHQEIREDKSKLALVQDDAYKCLLSRRVVDL